MNESSAPKKGINGLVLTLIILLALTLGALIAVLVLVFSGSLNQPAPTTPTTQTMEEDTTPTDPAPTEPTPVDLRAYQGCWAEKDAPGFELAIHTVKDNMAYISLFEYRLFEVNYIKATIKDNTATFRDEDGYVSGELTFEEDGILLNLIDSDIEYLTLGERKLTERVEESLAGFVWQDPNSATDYTPYMEALQLCDHSTDPSYYLHDLDGDNIQELFIFSFSERIGKDEISIWTLKDGACIKVDEVSQLFFLCEDGNIYLAESDGPVLMGLDRLTLKDGKLQREEIFPFPGFENMTADHEMKINAYLDKAGRVDNFDYSYSNLAPLFK